MMIAVVLVFMFPVSVRAAPLPTVTAGEIKAESVQYLSENGIEIPQEVKNQCTDAADQYGICPELLMSMCWVESRCNPDVTGGSCCGIC